MRAAILIAAISLSLTAPAIAKSFTVIEHALTDTTIHVGKSADGRGDILVFSNPVFDASNRTQVGHDLGYCVRIKPSVAYECHWNLQLQNGQIMVQGPFFDHADSVLAVTGGTGRYKNARGQMRLHARDAKGTEYSFIYNLTRSRK